MENYKKLLEEINLFLNNEEIESNDEIISLYDLYNIMDKEFINLRKLSTIDKTISQKLGRFRKFLIGNYDDFFIKNDNDVDFYSDENISRITFSNSDTEDSDDFYRISIIKDKNSDELYLDKEINYHNKQICRFIKNNFDLLSDTLLNIEEYHNLIGKVSNEKTDLHRFEGFTDLFYYKIVYDENGYLNIYNNISLNHPLYNESNKTYLSKKSIYEYVKEKNIDILKRIPISISELPKDILNIYNKNHNQTKEKELVKSKK